LDFLFLVLGKLASFHVGRQQIPLEQYHACMLLLEGTVMSTAIIAILCNHLRAN